MRQQCFPYWGEHRIIKRSTDFCTSGDWILWALMKAWQSFGSIKHFLAPNVEKLKKKSWMHWKRCFRRKILNLWPFFAYFQTQETWDESEVKKKRKSGIFKDLACLILIKFETILHSGTLYMMIDKKWKSRILNHSQNLETSFYGSLHDFGIHS